MRDRHLWGAPDPCNAAGIHYSEGSSFVLQAGLNGSGGTADRQSSSAAPGQYSRYGLDAPEAASRGQEADAEEEDDDAPGEANGADDQGGSGRRHLSAAERKALKTV